MAPEDRRTIPRAVHVLAGRSVGVGGVRNDRSSASAREGLRVAPCQDPCPCLLLGPASASLVSCTFSSLIALICASICANRSSAVRGGGAALPSPPVSISTPAANCRLVRARRTARGSVGLGCRWSFLEPSGASLASGERRSLLRSGRVGKEGFLYRT